jgi:catechol 2,3-dioxygenase-like lactoylglutathione lyase family enzyme
MSLDASKPTRTTTGEHMSDQVIKDPAPSISATRGVHHLALTTTDMKSTTDFYVHVVGMPLVHAMKVPAGLGKGPGNRGNPPYDEVRHYFFDMGNDSLLAFFEIPEGAEPLANRNAIGGMQHCSFVTDPQQFQALRERLTSHGVPYDGPLDVLPGVRSIYFFDPNGARLEACVQEADGNAPQVVRAVLQSQEETRSELNTVSAPASWVDAHVSRLRVVDVEPDRTGSLL